MNVSTRCDIEYWCEAEKIVVSRAEPVSEEMKEGERPKETTTRLLLKLLEQPQKHERLQCFCKEGIKKKYCCFSKFLTSQLPFYRRLASVK